MLAQQFFRVSIFICVFLGVSLQARDRWLEVKSPHFIVFTNAGEKKGQLIAEQFEQIRLVFENFFPSFNLDPGKPLIIIAAKNQKTLRYFLPDMFVDRKSKRFSGLFMSGGTRNIAMVDMEAVSEVELHVVFHEYTHSILLLNFDYLPLWLNEGLASFFETMEVKKKHVYIGQATRSVTSSIDLKRLIPLEEFLYINRDSSYYTQHGRAGVFYGQAWALTHYLMKSPQALEEKLMSKLLAQLEQNLPMKLVYQNTFGELAPFDDRLRHYLRKSRFIYSRHELSLKISPEQYVARPLSTNDVSAFKGYLFTIRQRVDQAKPILESVLAEEPDHLLALEAMGLRHDILRNRDEAMAYFDRILELDPTHLEANYFKAKLLPKEAAIPYFEGVLHTNPKFADAVSALGVLYSHLDRREKAIALIGRAINQERGDIGHRIRMLDALLAFKDYDKAMLYGQRIMNLTDNPRVQEDILKRMKAAAESKNREE